MNNLKENKLLYMILSVIIATTLWLYVVDAVNADADDTMRNIPITITGQDVLESRNLTVTGQSTNTMDVKVVGNRNALVRLTRDSFTVTADLSSINEAGEYELRCAVSVPNSNVGGTVSVSDRDSYRVRFTVEEKVKKVVPVEGSFSGSVASGYQAESFILSPSSIEITGPSSLVDPVERARVTLSATDLNTTYSGILPFELINQDGTTADLKNIQCAASTVYVVYPIVMVREIELKVNFVDGGGATKEDAAYEVTPQTIQISGDESHVAGMTELVLGTIDLSQVGTTGAFTFPISLPAGLTNDSGITTASASVKVVGLTTKTFETDQIELINAPDGFYVEAVTQSLKITVRGSREAVEGVSARKLRVVADLSELGESEGQFRVPVKVYLDSTGDVGVFGADYTISVNLWK